MGLFAAEMRKLWRPLWWATALATAGFCVLLAWGAVHNASAAISSPKMPNACDGSTSPVCVARLAQVHQQGRADGQGLASLLQPGRVGTVASGMLASLPGVLVVALLAGGHVGSEWSGKTIRTVLTHESRRWRVLIAKWASLWLGSAGVMIACWAALAVAGPLLASAGHLPHAHQGSWGGLGAGAGQVGRALLVLALFAALGVSAATLTRNTVGTIAAVVGVAVVALMVGELGSAAQWTPATSIQAWMHFDAGLGYLPTNYWSRFLSSGAALGTGRAIIELLACFGVLAFAAGRRIRADVTA
jgi:hypothetical protein